MAQHPGITFDTLEKGGWALKIYQKKRTEKLENLEPDFDDDQIHALVLDKQPNLDGRPKTKEKETKESIVIVVLIYMNIQTNSLSY